MKKKKVFIILLLLIVVSISVFFIFLIKKDEISGNKDFSSFQQRQKSNTSTTLTQNAEVKSSLDEKVELHATYYLEEVYVEENEYVEAGANILKYTNGTYLVAPYDCCIVKLNLPDTSGQILNSHYVEIKSTNILSVTMKVDESNINKIEIGKEVKIDISATNKTYIGYITHIGSTANNGKFEITIQFENDRNIKLGMTSTLNITL